MKQLANTAALVVVLLLLVALPAQAQSPRRKQTIKQLADKVAVAYTSKNLAGLDAAHPYSGKVKIIIEHSLGDESYEVKLSQKLEYAEEWLKNREREDGTPFREARDLLQCRRGVCTFDLDGGISHNHLYLQKIFYGYRKGAPYIKTLYLLDGD